MKQTNSKDLISTSETPQLLGVSCPKTSRLLKDGHLSAASVTRIDKRVKLQLGQRR